MATGDLLGIVGAGLVFASFWMESSVRLRSMALASNVVFIGYAYAAGLLPILLLHAALLPLNAVRLWQLRHPLPETDDGLIDWLLPQMAMRQFTAGERLMIDGEPAREILLLKTGKVTVGDQHAPFGPGQLLGAIGVFSRERRVVRSVTALTDGQLYYLDAGSVRRLQRANPGLASYLTSLVTDRLIDHARLRKGAPSRAIPQTT